MRCYLWALDLKSYALIIGAENKLWDEYHRNAL